MVELVDRAAVAAISHEQSESDVRALQSIDLRVLLYLAVRPADDALAAAADIALALRVPRQTVAWRPLGRLAALELVDIVQLIGQRAPYYRITARGAAAAALVRNPSIASKESTRRHLRFVAPARHLEPVA